MGPASSAKSEDCDLGSLKVQDTSLLDLEAYKFSEAVDWVMLLLPLFVACELSCPRAGGILPDQGSNLRPLHWQTPNHQTTREARPGLFK